MAVLFFFFPLWGCIEVSKAKGGLEAREANLFTPISCTVGWMLEGTTPKLSLLLSKRKEPSPTHLSFLIFPQSESAPSLIWSWKMGRCSWRVGTSQLWTEPGWISGVTLTSIWWAAPGASVVRGSGVPPSPTARVRGTAASHHAADERMGVGWEWMVGNVGYYRKWGALGGRGESPTLSSIQLPQTSSCSPQFPLLLGWGFLPLPFYFYIFSLLPILGSHIVSFPLWLSPSITLPKV